MAPSPRCAEPTPPLHHLRSSKNGGFATQEGGLVAYTAATPCTNDNGPYHIPNTAIPLSGVYFISGTLKITGTPVISGTATFILLPGATINNQGNAVINITGPTTAPSASSLPAALQSSASLFQYMAVYDASANPRDLRRKYQHHPQRRHLRADRSSDVSGQSDFWTWAAETVVASWSPPRSRSMVMQPSTTLGQGVGRRNSKRASTCSWCNDEKARSSRRRSAGILPYRRALFASMLLIMDLRRYAITVQSLRTLASADARAMMIQLLHTRHNQATHHPLAVPCHYLSGCGESNRCPLSVCWRSHTFTEHGSGAAALTVTASQPAFTMLMPIWGTALNAPSASTLVPF